MFSGPITMGGVGGVTSQSKYGIYQISIPLRNGSDAIMTGPCLDQITQKFPYYPLNGDVLKDIKDQYEQEGKDSDNLPSVPAKVGGHIDFMLGIKYLRYFPETIFQLPPGLTIYKSHFFNSDGSCGVIGGPHEIFNSIGQTQSTNFIVNQLNLYQNGYHVNPDLRMLGYSNQLGDVSLFPTKITDEEEESFNQKLNIFNEVEKAGSELLYRCFNCRGCTTCNNQSTDIISIKEETEQEVINASVAVDIENHISIAKLPLLCDPSFRLQPNRDVALKVYNQQMKRLSKNVSD